MECTKCIIDDMPSSEMMEHGNFLHICRQCHCKVAICPLCKKEMTLKFSKSIKEEYFDAGYCLLDFQIYWCSNCKNIEVIEC